MKKITIGLALFLGLCACGMAGSSSDSENTINYDFPTVRYEKHEPVVYPAGARPGF